MFGFLKKIFVRLLTIIVNASDHKKCVYLNNQKCTTHPTVINLYTNEISLTDYVNDLKKLKEYFNDLFNRACVSNKTDYANLSVSSMISWINESKSLKSVYANVNVNLMAESVI